MATAHATEDLMYQELFDVATEAVDRGNATDIDVNAALNSLRDRAPVQEGSLRDLLGMEPEAGHSIERHTFSVFSFKACDQVFRDNMAFTSYAYNDTPGGAVIGNTILGKIGEEHRRLRAAAQLMFLKPTVTNWWRKNWIDDTSNDLLDRLQDMETADLNLDLCARLPMHVVTTAVGMEGSDALYFRGHLLKSIGSRRVSPEEQLHSFMEVERMLQALIAQRRVAPHDDVVSGLLAADFKLPDGGTRKLTHDEVAGYCRLLLLAGGGTTWRQLGITLHVLLSNYHFWEACRDDRSLVPNAVEEAARWNATDPVFPRLVMEDTEFEGFTIAAGSRVEVCLGAANRDPERWINPDAFDPYRPFQQHLAFGIGPHHCLGQYVARQEMIVAINGLLDRFPRMRLDPAAPPQRLAGGLEQRGMTAVPVILH